MKSLQRYYQFILSHSPTLKVGEIILVPNYDEERHIIVWEIKNPKNVSYSYYVLKGYIQELLNTYSEYMGKEFYNQLDGYQRVLSYENIYLTLQDEKEFLSKAKSTELFSYKEIQMDIEAFDLDTSFSSDGVHFRISVICKNPFNKETNKYLSYDGLKDVLDYHKEWDSYFDYVDNTLFTPLINYIWSGVPELFDNSYQMISVSVRYFTPDKKEIKLY